MHAAVFDAFAERFAEQTAGLKLGTGHDWSIQMGSLTSRRQLDAVSAHVDDAVANGATVLTGGKARPDLGPLFYEPTVLTGITEDMRLCRDETFGPVVGLYRFASDDEAVDAGQRHHLRAQRLRLDLRPGARPRARHQDQSGHGQHQRGVRRRRTPPMTRPWAA